MFRSIAATDDETEWGSANPSRLASFVMGAQPHGPIVTCAYCHEVDHSAAECALALIQQKGTCPSASVLLPTTPPPPPPPPPSPTQLRQLLPTQMRQFPPAYGYDQRPVRICISWNKGKCMLPGSCAFRHICAVCRTADHMARDCDQAPADSPYKRQLQPPAKAQMRVAARGGVLPLQIRDKLA